MHFTNIDITFVTFLDAPKISYEGYAKFSRTVKIDRSIVAIKMEPSKKIAINCGGVHFQTTLQTVDRSVYLKTLFSDRWENQEEERFIDRSGVLFEHVLNYLRNPEYPYPREHAAELDFYGIEHHFADYIREDEKKLAILWKHFKETSGVCQIGLCDALCHKGYKYCFECQPPRYVNYHSSTHLKYDGKLLSWKGQLLPIKVSKDCPKYLMAFSQEKGWRSLSAYKSEGASIVVQDDPKE